MRFIRYLRRGRGRDIDRPQVREMEIHGANVLAEPDTREIWAATLWRTEID